MAKQVLDLFELYNLVVARGGLVEVINKKLWQEVIKGLGLPSSITSAAFTLRTQYTKYLYPLECRNNNLSSPHELQAAIEGNKREGRRTSYGSYPSDLFPGAGHLPPSILGGHPNPGSPFQLPPRSLPQINGSPGHLPLHPPSKFFFQFSYNYHSLRKSFIKLCVQRTKLKWREESKIVDMQNHT